MCFLNHPLWPGRWSHPRLKAALFGSRGRRDVFFHQERAGEKACKENPHPVRELRDSTEMGLVSLVIAEDVVVQSLSLVRLFVTPWTAALQASLSFIISWSLLRLMSIESVMPSTVSSSVVPFSSCLHSFPASLVFSHDFLSFPMTHWSFPVSQLFQVTKVLELQLQHQSFQCIFRVDFL